MKLGFADKAAKETRHFSFVCPLSVQQGTCRLLFPYATPTMSRLVIESRIGWLRNISLDKARSGSFTPGG